MDDTAGDPMRDLSVGVFGNAKVAAVVLGVVDLDGGTAKKIADHTGVTYTLARDVLVRFERAGLLESFRDGEGARAPLIYLMRETEIWTALAALAHTVRNAAERRLHGLQTDSRHLRPSGRMTP